MYKKLLLVVCVCFMAFLAGCKGDDGAVGPQGEKGETGATGATGPAGSGGAGASAIILTTGAVTGTGTDGDLSFVIDDQLDAESEAFYDSSVVVMVYGKSLGVWWPLPGIVQFTGQAVSNFTFVHGVDQATFFLDILTTGWSEDTDTAPTRSFDDIRIVLVPASSGARLSADVNWKSYDETILALGLNDSNAKKTTLYKKK